MDLLIFQRLTQDLQAFSGKFRHLIQKKNTSVCKSDLPRPRYPAATCQSLRGTGMMRTSKRPLPDQRIFFREKSCHTVYLGDLQAFLKCHLRHNGRQTSCQHGLSGSWRSDKKNIMKTAHCDLCRPPGSFLPADVRKINLWFFLFIFCFFFLLIRSCTSVWVSQTPDHVIQTFYSKHRHILHQIPLPDVFLRNNAKA